MARMVMTIEKPKAKIDGLVTKLVRAWGEFKLGEQARDFRPKGYEKGESDVAATSELIGAYLIVEEALDGSPSIHERRALSCSLLDWVREGKPVLESSAWPAAMVPKMCLLQFSGRVLEIYQERPPSKFEAAG